MNFTREPIIETVITPKEGYKLVVRNSKGAGQEEFFVDALEVVVFGKSSFYRSFEKPKSFLVPVNDYEILEVREARMNLKSSSVERVKIGGGKQTKGQKEKEEESVAEVAEKQVEKRRERRRTRKRKEKGEEEETPSEEGERGERPSLIPPPSTLISDSMIRLKEEEGDPLPETEEETASPQVIEPPPPPPPPEEPEEEVTESTPQGTSD